MANETANNREIKLKEVSRFFPILYSMFLLFAFLGAYDACLAFQKCYAPSASHEWMDIKFKNATEPKFIK